MWKSKIEIFIVLTGLIVLLLVIGTIVFLLQYRAKKIAYELERRKINEQHEIELLNTRLESKRQTQEYIGQELHDSVAQKITLASIYLRHLGMTMEDRDENKRLASAASILDNSLEELRQLSKSLVSNDLENSSLLKLIRDECALLKSMGNYRIVLDVADAIPLTIPFKISLFRIFQEFIQNSIKHSACTQIEITIKHREGQVAAVFRDDGIGFDVNEQRITGIGLSNMSRRAQVLGAGYSFSSTLGAGTSLTLTVPLRDA